jgi:hypothetical protein
LGWSKLWSCLNPTFLPQRPKRWNGFLHKAQSEQAFGIGVHVMCVPTKLLTINNIPGYLQSCIMHHPPAQSFVATFIDGPITHTHVTFDHIICVFFKSFTSIWIYWTKERKKATPWNELKIQNQAQW